MDNGEEWTTEAAGTPFEPEPQDHLAREEFITPVQQKVASSICVCLSTSATF